MLTLTKKDIGCIFDGVAGQTHNDLRLIRWAEEHGFDPGETVSEEMEFLYETAEDALAYLNENGSFPDYCSLFWDDGNLIFAPDVESAKEDCQDNIYDDLASVPDDLMEPFILVTDHGNVTYGYLEGGEFVGVWSQV